VILINKVLIQHEKYLFLLRVFVQMLLNSGFSC